MRINMDEKQEDIKDKNINNIDWKVLEEHWVREYNEDYVPKNKQNI